MSPSDTNKKTLLDLPSSLYIDRPTSTRDLISNLTPNFFVSIISESGSGKSSLVKNGLAQELQKGMIQGGAGNDWRMVLTQPFADPLGNLASDLCKPGALFDGGARDADFRIEVEKKLRENDGYLSELYNEALLASNKAFNLLIVVDQKQELSRYKSFLEKSEKNFDDVHYVNLLLNAYRSKAPIYIVIISDSRYFEYFAKYRGLPEAMNNFAFRVPFVEEAEVRAFIQQYLPVENEASERYQTEFAFMDRILLDFKAISGETENTKKDPFALQKLNLCLSIVLEKWRNAKDQSQNVIPLNIYNEVGGLESIIKYFIEKQVFTDKRYNPTEKGQVKRLFQALTRKAGNNHYVRRPVILQDLQNLTKRQEGDGMKMLGFGEIRALLAPFNDSGESFVRLPELHKLSPDSIIDVDSDSLLSNWPELAKWIEQESINADVYLNLVKDATAYYAPGELPEKSEQEVLGPNDVSLEPSGFGFDRLRNLVRNLLSHITSKETATAPGSDPNLSQRSVYDGARLVSAMRWHEKGTYNEAWALQYAPEKPELTIIQQDQLKLSLPNLSTNGLTNFKLAKKFLEESAHKFQDALKVAKGQVDTANKQRKIATISAIVSIILGIIAIVFWVQVCAQKQNIELIDFVEVLEYNGALDIHPSEGFKKMRELITTIVGEKDIDDRDKVLEFLADQKVLELEPVLKLNKLQYRALINIDVLFKELKTNDMLHKKSIEDVKQIYTEAKKLFPNDSEHQFPWLYYALYSHINQRIIDTVYRRSTSIDGGAMAARPKPDGYAFGDKNGDVCLRTTTDRMSLPNAKSVIKGLGFSSDGNSLVVGTELGKVLLYDRLNLPKGVSSSARVSNKHFVYQDTLKKSLYFVKLWPNDPEKILICNTFQVYFIKKDRTGNSYTPYGNVCELPQQRVVCREWLPGDSLFLAAGRGSTIIYRLLPNNPNASVEEIGWIRHDTTTITSLAIKSELINGERKFCLALGSEFGKVWVIKNLNSLEGDFNVADFQHFDDCHETTISSMAFNPGRPQMASASIDGVIRFWNLNKIGEKYNDDIVLRNYGQGSSSIAYLNKNELAVHQDLYDWVIKTNVDELMLQLECLIKHSACQNGFSH